jgi:hypothetical protein
MIARGGIACADIVAQKRLVSEGGVITRGHAGRERLKHTYSIAVGGAVTRRSFSAISGVLHGRYSSGALAHGSPHCSRWYCSSTALEHSGGVVTAAEVSLNDL